MWKKDKRKVKEKTNKKNHSNRWSVLKSSILAILTLLVFILPFYLLHSTSFAELTKKYQYTFDLGTSSDGLNYTYTIITQERKTGEGGTTGNFTNNNSCDVWIIDSYWSNLPDVSNYIDVANEVGAKSLYDYMCMVSYTDYDEYEPDIISKDTTLMKRLIYAGIDAGYTFTVENNSDDENEEKRYAYDASATTYGWGRYKSSGIINKKYTDYKTALEKPNAHRDHCVLQLPDTEGKRSFADSVKVNGPGMVEKGSAFSSCYRDDQWVCWMITKALENGNGSGIKYVKKEITNGVKEDTNGDYKYQILEDTINKEKATVDIAVFRKKFNSREYEHIFTFRYTKGAKTGKMTPTIMLPTFVEKAHSDDNMATGYYAFWRNATYTASTGRLQTWPMVDSGGGTYEGTDKLFREVAGDCYLYFNESNCIVEHLDGDTYEYDTMVTAPFVFDETNHVLIGYVAAHAGGENFEPLGEVTVHNQLGGQEFSNASSKIYFGIKIPHSTLDKVFPDDVAVPSGDQIDDGNWHLTRYSKVKSNVVAWNEPQSDDEQQEYLVMNFGRGFFYKLYFDYYCNWTAAKTGLYLGCPKKDENWNQKKYSYTWEKNNSKASKFFENVGLPDTEFKNQWAPILVASTKGDIPEKDMPSKTSGDIEKAIVKDIAVTEGYRVYLQFYDSKASTNSNRGKDTGDKFTTEAFLLKSDGTPVSFDVTEWLREEYTEEEEEEARDDETTDNLLGQKSLWGGYLTLEELEENQNEFFRILMRYSRPIIMFLIFLTIVYTAIFSIMHNQDAGKRALVKERLKHITIGIILFAAVVGILFLCKSLMDTSYEKITETAGATIVNPFDTPEPDYEENWFVDLLIDLIDAVAGIIQWMINSIMMSVVGDAADLNSLIFNTSLDENYMTLAPFTTQEWNRYMFGYRALEALALALLAIAIIKFAAELIIHASDSEKTAQAKETCLRVAVAMLAIVLGPYVVRLLLTLFNYLITLIPLRTVNLDLGFSDTGIIGAVANCMFVWMKFKIYLVFVVRKLMITFMLLITPVVFGLWAISNKFRSMSLWIGELFTNAATQFCYALVFFGASLIMYDQQSDFVSLILILMFMKLADFFKDSLQGLVQKWGGIDETRVAEGAIDTGKKYLNKGINATKRTAGKVGDAFIGTANSLDPKNVSDGGRRARNFGALLKGDIWSLQGKNTTYQNRANALAENAGKEQDKLSRSDKAVDTWSKQANIKDLRQKKLRGEVLTPEEQQRLDFADHYLGVRSGNVSLEESKALAEANPDNEMYLTAHQANVARSNRDIYQNASDNAQSQVKSHGVDLDNWKTKNDSESESNNRQISEEFTRTRDRLAEKTADLKATNMFDGEKDPRKLLEQATGLMEDATKFNKETRDAKVNNGINLDSIKDTIAETLTHCNGFESSESYEKLSDFCKSKDDINNFGPNNETSAASTDAFEKKVNARIDTLKKSGVIK